MKVTGITEADLAPVVPPESPPRLESPRSTRSRSKARATEASARRYEVLEQKRQRLSGELEEIADSLDDLQVESLLSPRPGEEEKVKAWYEEQTAQVDRMRGKLKAQVQREAQRELSRQEMQDAAMKDREAVAKRLKEQAAERRAQLKEQADKRSVQEEKIKERLRAGLRAEKERRDGITQRLSTDMERVSKLVETRRSDFVNKSEGSKGRVEEIKERKEAHEQTLLVQKLRRVEEATEKDQKVEARFQQLQEETRQKFREKGAKFESKMSHVEETLLEQERERQKQYKEHLEKMQACRKAAQEEVHKIAESTKETRDRRLQKWETSRQAQRSARREHLRELKSQLAKDEVKSVEVRAKYLEEMVYEKAANKGLFTDVVQQNLQRLQRSDEYARAHTLAKIEREIERTKAIEAHKKVIMDQRSSAIRESMLGRLKVEELKGVKKDDGESSVKRVNGILRDLDMAPLSTEKEKQGEEGEQQQK